MAVRYQLQDEKHPYASPTTPGLYVTFRAYIIELICLNVNKSIGPRFWSDKKYWGPKFSREVKGVYNVLKQLEEIGLTTPKHTVDILIQTAFIEIIKEHNIKSLSYKITIKKVVRSICQKKSDLEQQRIKLRERTPRQEVNIKENSTFIDTGKKGVLAKIREVENG